MKKPSISFVCQECGYDSPKFMGKCPECGSWNSMREFTVSREVQKIGSVVVPTQLTVKKLGDIQASTTKRMASGFSELDTVLGGGIVSGAVMLLAGDPGVGKSTLLLQLSLLLAREKTVLYISGEESLEQVRMRSLRLIDGKDKAKQEENLLLLATTDIDQAISKAVTLKPQLIIVDSIQTMQSQNIAGLSGSVPQVRYGALQLVSLAKASGVPVIIVGHVTKEGMVAGPMILSHMVDTVLFLEGERFSKMRIVRSLKNRFGPIDEVGVFFMEEAGMHEVKDPSQLFLRERQERVPGSILVVTMEGSRAFLVELQALAMSSRLPMPRRVVSGLDPRRVELLLAVLQKHCRLPLDTTDVFVNVAGGIKISDPAVDLGICLAVYSSLKNISLSHVVGISEVGLLGELRNVAGLDRRIREAKQLGFTDIVSAKNHKTLFEALGTLEKGGKA